MRKKNGFTLPELLAALVILAVLLGLAIPAVGSYMKKGTQAYYSGLETDILAAGRDYLLDYKSLYPREVGNSMVITLDELVENNYVTSPTDEKGNACDAKITVVKTGRNKYDYHICLICGKYYQSDTKECEYKGNNTVSKNYTINLNGELPTKVNQGADATIPTARVTESQGSESKLIDDQLSGRPKTLDTTALGTTTVTWSYRTKKISRNITVVDAVSPVIESLELRYSSGSSYNGSATNRDMTLYINVKDYACLTGSECQRRYPNLEGSGIKSIQYKEKNDSNWTVYNTKKGNVTVPIQKTIWGELQVKAVDASGNSSAIETVKIQVDRNIPGKTTISYLKGSSSTKWQNQIQIKMSATDDVAIRYYEIYKEGAYYGTTGDTWTPPNNFNSDSVKFRAVDIAGNKGPFSEEQKIHMDTQKPGKTSVNLNGYTSNTWTNQNVQQTYTASDNVGIAYYEYATSNTATTGTKTTNPWTISKDGEWTYYARAVDQAGNAGPWSDPYIVKRDTVKPQCKLKVISDTKKYGDWYIGPTTIGFESHSDDRSGINTIGADMGVSSTTPKEGKTLTGWVVDYANNKTTCTITLKVDVTTPSITAKENPIELDVDNYAFNKNVNYTFGPAGGKVTCDPTNSAKLGVYNVSCTAIGNNGKSQMIAFAVRRNYKATKDTCYNTSGEEYTCYTCPNGGSLNGTTCKFTYTISYNANGGRGAPSNQIKTHGTSITLSNTTPTRVGYSFLGWSTSPNGSVEYRSGQTYDTDKNLQLYARWQDLYTDSASYAHNNVTTSNKLLFNKTTKSGIYNYAPTAFMDDDGEIHMFYVGNKDSTQIVDHIYHRTIKKNTSTGYSYSSEDTLLMHSSGKWDSVQVCDPTVIKGNFKYNGTTYKYLMIYLGVATYDNSLNQIGLAVSNNLQSQFVKVSVNEPFIHYPSNSAWGVGQPSAVNLDGNGRVLITYTQGLTNKTSQYFGIYDLSNLNIPKTITAPKEISATGALSYISNAEIAIDLENDKIWMTAHQGNTYENNSVTGTANYIPSRSMIMSKKLGLSSYSSLTEAITTALTTSTNRWSATALSNGSYLVHNPGFIRDPYGYVNGIGNMQERLLISTASKNGDQTSQLWTYKIQLY